MEAFQLYNTATVVALVTSNRKEMQVRVRRFLSVAVQPCLRRAGLSGKRPRLEVVGQAEGLLHNNGLGVERGPVPE
jgi:hypothetical protein